jgi:thiosulfate/3-mercaptopyruvate sulfurtransferase
MLRRQARLALFALSITAFAGAAGARAGQEPQDFANPQLLVKTAWLAAHGNANGVIVLDVRDQQDYAAAHVPGARSLPVAEVYSATSRGNIAASEQLTAALSARGISAATHIVVYDAGASIPAARVFWTLEVLGHEKVSVLDGGFAKWKVEGRSTSTAVPTSAPAEYVVASTPRGHSSREQVLADVEQPDVVMLDARSAREYGGGRIPSAIHIEWTHNYTDAEVPVFKSATELRKLYTDQGVIPGKRVHAY